MGEKITVKIIVNRDISFVWKAWTQPEHIIKWNFASDDWLCSSASNDLKNGGKFSYRMEAKDRSMGFDFTGSYDDIEECSKIEFTLDDKRKACVSFVSTEKSTEITEMFDPDSTVSIEMQQAGWQSILNNFKKYVESL